MAVYPKGDKFMASVGTGSTRVRKTFTRESDALTWEVSQDLARAASDALPAPLPTVWTLQQAFDQTLKHVWKGTGGEYKAVLNANQALSYFGADTLTSEITSSLIVEWMEELQESGNSGATCNRKLSALSMMLKRAEDYGNLPAVPRMKLYKESKHRVCWFSDADEQAMLTACDRLGLPELHDFIVVGLDTGFRFSELLQLSLRDYVKGNLILHAGETKGGSARSVPCSQRVKAIIDKRQQASGYLLFPSLTASVCRNQWEAVRASLGRQDDPAWIIHVMRHTCATRLVGEGVPLNVVQAWMGHAAITTTMRYAHMTGGQLYAAAVLMAGRQVNTGEVA